MTVFTPRTLADEWGVSERHVRNLIANGELRAVRFGQKLLRIREEDVEDFVCRQITDSPSIAESGASLTTTNEADDTALRLVRLTRTKPNSF